MEWVSGRVYKGIRGYERLSGTGRRSKNRVELAAPGSNRRRRRFWNFKISPKLKLRFSPKKFFSGLRDAYVKMMLGIANSGVIRGGFPGGGFDGFGTAPLKEYDERRIVEIYKTVVMAQDQLVPRDATRIRGDIVYPL